MRIAARATGVGVPAGDFAGQVTESHARAALVKLADGWCVTLLGSELGRQPRGISLDLPESMSLRHLLSVSAECAKRGGVIRFAGSALAIDLRGARPWRSGIAALDFDGRNVAAAAAYRAATSALEHDGRAQRFSATARAKLNGLAESIRERDPAAAERGMAGLMGLGEGKTPAGDDYLVGICAALWSCAATRVLAAALAPKIMTLAARCGDLSGLYLQEAANGEVSERLSGVAAGICAGGSENVVGNAVARALAVGHSSGAAGVLGLLDGYAACAEAPLQANADADFAAA